VSALLASVLTAAAMLTLGAQRPPAEVDAVVMAHGGAVGVERRVKGELGPPAWARAGGQAAHRGKADHSWKDRWHALTPAQKSQKMAALARAHRDGMRKWGKCAHAAGTDRTKRVACEKPLPPGLAKKQP
jgi:hypothetical protein